MTEQPMTPAKAADAAEPLIDDVHRRGWDAEPLRVLRNHARATASTSTPENEDVGSSRWIADRVLDIVGGDCGMADAIGDALSDDLAKHLAPATPADHRMIPGSHERPGGAECVCGRRWCRWHDVCETQRAPVIDPQMPSMPDVANDVRAVWVRKSGLQCAYCGVGIYGFARGYHDAQGREVCPSGQSPTSFHEPGDDPPGLTSCNGCGQPHGDDEECSRCTGLAP